MEYSLSKKNIFFRISSFQMLAMFRRGLFYSFMSIYLRYFLGLSVTETTYFATFPMILNTFFQTYIWGIVSDKTQKRKSLIIWGELLAGVGTFLVWYFHHLVGDKRASGYIVIIGMTLVEIFWSMSNVGWSAMISDFFSERERTGIQGKLSSLGGLGRIVGVLIGGLAYDGFSRQFEGWGFSNGFLFFVASAVMILSTIPLFKLPEGGVNTPELIDDLNISRDRNIEGKSMENNQNTDNRLKTRKTKTDLIENKGFQVKLFTFFLIALIFINFGRNSVSSISSQYLKLGEGFNLSNQMLSYIVNMNSLGLMLFGFIIGRINRKISDEMLLIIGSVLSLLYLIGFAFARSIPILFISSFLLGISEVVITSSSYTIVSKIIPPEKRGKFFGFYNATFFLSWGIGGTLLAGPIADILIKKGQSYNIAYKASFLSGSLLIIIGLILFIIFSAVEYRKKKQNSPINIG